MSQSHAEQDIIKMGNLLFWAVVSLFLLGWLIFVGLVTVYAKWHISYKKRKARRLAVKSL